MKNNKEFLKEIKQGEVGNGFLFEGDGHISMLDNSNRPLFESITSNADGSWNIPEPFIVHAVFQKFGKKNANGRIYPESVLKKQVAIYQEKIKERRAYGELNHPQDSTIDLGRLALNIIELHWEGSTLVGQLEIITTRGFRETGICSTVGDQLANLLLNKLKVGVSSRGIGSVNMVDGDYVVGDDFELVCWDAVSDPSTPGAWVDKKKENLEMYIEDIQHVTPYDGLDAIRKWLNN